MIATPPRGLLLFGVEPEFDCAGGRNWSEDRSRPPHFVVGFSPFMSESLRKRANVVLPTAAPLETPGTFVNAEGRWQSFDAAARPVGESRPAWKVLRVIGSRIGLPDCDYAAAEAIRDEARQAIGEVRPDHLAIARIAPAADAGQPVTLGELDVPMYQIDALVRRATALQRTDDGLAAQVPDDRLRA